MRVNFACANPKFELRNALREIMAEKRGKNELTAQQEEARLRTMLVNTDNAVRKR